MAIIVHRQLDPNEPDMPNVIKAGVKAIIMMTIHLSQVGNKINSPLEILKCLLEPDCLSSLEREGNYDI